MALLELAAFVAIGLVLLDLPARIASKAAEWLVRRLIK